VCSDLTASLLTQTSWVVKPAFVGMRIPVSLIVNLVAHGKSVEEILEEYPDLEPEDIKQALEYAAWLVGK
jgi:uncharacterized protein (DUF433 family)